MKYKCAGLGGEGGGGYMDKELLRSFRLPIQRTERKLVPDVPYRMINVLYTYLFLGCSYDRVPGLKNWRERCRSQGLDWRFADTNLIFKLPRLLSSGLPISRTGCMLTAAYETSRSFIG